MDAPAVLAGGYPPGDADMRSMLQHWKGLQGMVSADQAELQALASSQAHYLAVALENYHRCRGLVLGLARALAAGLAVPCLSGCCM